MTPGTVLPPDPYSAPTALTAPRDTGVVAFLGEKKREGRWWMPRHLRVLAISGSAKIDLRDALIEPGLSVIEAVAIFGSIDVIASPEIGVECDGDAFGGSFSMEFEGRASTIPRGDRVVRVIGSAYGGAVTVIVKGPPTEGVLSRLGRTLGIG